MLVKLAIDKYGGLMDENRQLDITDEADEFRFYCACGCGRMGFEIEGVDHIVAAELERLAREFDPSTDGEWRQAADALLARAAELRGEPR
jgi:hypothetical protein